MLGYQALGILCVLAWNIGWSGSFFLIAKKLNRIRVPDHLVEEEEVLPIVSDNIVATEG
jgi:hypothetical protein